MSRLIVLDTETTGLDPKKNRLTEIACVELIDYTPTGKTFHTLINPCQEVSEGAHKITGYTWKMLKEYPEFHVIAPEFVDFIGQDELVIHNAPFDVGFLNMELSRIGYSMLDPIRIIDTLKIARKKFPGSPNNLDALCNRLKISLHKRDKHSAIVDTELLAHVFIELMGKRQKKLDIVFKENAQTDPNEKKSYEKRSFPLSSQDEEKHKDFLEKKLAHHKW